LAAASVSFCQSEKEETMLWRVSGKGLSGNSYLFGVINSKDSSFYKFPDKMWRYFAATDVFVTTNDKANHSLFNNSIGKYERHFEQSPTTYIKQQAVAAAKPVITLKDEVTLSGAFKDVDVHNTINTANLSRKLEDLKMAYGSGKLQEVTNIRKQLDVPQQVLSQLHHKQLRARGLAVKPMDVKFYDKREQTLIAQRNYIAAVSGQPSASTGSTQPQGATGPSTSAPVRRKFNKEMPGLLDKEWQRVYTSDSLYSASFPGSASKLENEDGSVQFSLNEGGLTFSFSVKPTNLLVSNVADVNTRLVLQTGGQVSQSNKANYSGLSGTQTELIHADNKISRFFVASLGDKLVEISVSGKPPHIFASAVQAFFNSVQIKPAALPATVLTANSTVLEIVESWPSFRTNNLYGMLPITPATKNETTEGGVDVETHQIFNLNDGNKYLVAVNPKSTFDNFMLFNTSINAAAEEAKAVIVNRNVMENGRTNYAKYQLKDALDNYYHIEYWYDGTHFYQFVVKGDKKSISNATVNKISNSLVLTVSN